MTFFWITLSQSPRQSLWCYLLVIFIDTGFNCSIFLLLSYDLILRILTLPPLPRSFLQIASNCSIRWCFFLCLLSWGLYKGSLNLFIRLSALSAKPTTAIYCQSTQSSPSKSEKNSADISFYYWGSTYSLCFALEDRQRELHQRPEH